MNSGRPVPDRGSLTVSSTAIRPASRRMVRAGQSSERGALIYQHSDDDRQREVADGLDELVRAEREKTNTKIKRGASGADLVQGA